MEEQPPPRINHDIKSPMLGDVIVRLMINKFSKTFLVTIPFSLITTRLKRINRSSRTLAPGVGCRAEFYIRLYTLKSPISIILSVIT